MLVPIHIHSMGGKTILEVNGYQQLFGYTHLSKYLFVLCSSGERNSGWDKWGGENDDRIFSSFSEFSRNFYVNCPFKWLCCSKPIRCSFYGMQMVYLGKNVLVIFNIVKVNKNCDCQMTKKTKKKKKPYRSLIILPIQFVVIVLLLTQSYCLASEYFIL